MSKDNWFHEDPSEAHIQNILKNSESLLAKNRQTQMIKQKRRWMIFSGIGLALASAALWLRGPANKKNDFETLVAMDADEFAILTESDLDLELEMLTDLDVLEQLESEDWS